MKEFGMMILLMCIGSGLVFFFKGVLEIRADPDFQAIDFVHANANRLVWLGLGLFLTAAALFLDAAGLESLYAAVPFGLQIASPLVLGAALSGLVLIIPSNKSS